MSLDQRVVKSLNHWGLHHQWLVKICSNDFVYAAIVIAAVWLLIRVVNLHRPIQNYKTFIFAVISKGTLIFAIPVGVATVISELISKFYVRQRPFVGMQGIKLFVPHSADGGMPSHHMVFMIALITMIYFYNRKLALVLAFLTLISGIARVAAGIHYPTDILVGILLGWAVSTIYLRITRNHLKAIMRL